MPEIRIFATDDAPGGVLAEIRALLDVAFDDYSEDDWQNALGGWHVVVADGGMVVAHAAVVPRRIEVGGRPLRAGYVESVGTAPDRQAEGLGSVAMTELSEIVRREFEMGALSTGAHGFYERLGWERWRGPTFVRRRGRGVRSEDDDGGVMVLRFGPSEGVDLHASLSCAERPGDDW